MFSKNPLDRKLEELREQEAKLTSDIERLETFVERSGDPAFAAEIEREDQEARRRPLRSEVRRARKRTLWLVLVWAAILWALYYFLW